MVHVGSTSTSLCFILVLILSTFSTRPVINYLLTFENCSGRGKCALLRSMDVTVNMLDLDMEVKLSNPENKKQ